MKLEEIAVLVPCYNEEKTIFKVVTDFKKVIPNSIVYVYDNNSTDNTVAEAIRAGARIGFENHQGKGNVVRRMFREIDAKIYILVDGDDTYDPSSAKKMIEMIKNHGYDMVIGDRLSSTYYDENKRPFHNFGNALMKNLINRAFKTNIKDIMTGYRCFNYSFVKTFPAISMGFDIETEMTVFAIDRHFNIGNVIVDYKDRPEGSVSKLNTVKDGLLVLKKFIFYYMVAFPLNFFVGLALLFIVIGLLIFIPIFNNFINTGLVPKIPSLLFSVMFFIISIICVFVGIILNVIKFNDSKVFEYRYMQIMKDYKNYNDRRA